MDQDTNEAEYKLDWITNRFDMESKVSMFLWSSFHFEPTHYDALRRFSTKCQFLGRYVSVSYNMDNMENRQAYFNSV